MISRSRFCLRRRGAGIVGLPNVGKSTFFNALTCSQLAKTGNFPFCTINANRSRVPVHDPRAFELARLSKAEKIVPAEVDLTDVAGLIAGASKGEGLGNQFLNDIRNCDLLLHLVRCFESEKDGFDRPNPLEDISVIMNELVLSDLQAVEKKYHKVKTRGKQDKEVLLCQKLLASLESGRPASDLHKNNKGNESSAKSAQPSGDEQLLRDYQLLTLKPMVFVLNVDDASLKNGNSFSDVVQSKYGKDNTCVVSAAVEEQIAQLPTREERLDFLKEYGITEPRGEKLMRQVYHILGLQSFFTVGPLQVHAWTVRQGENARQASGEIHSDFEKHFVRAKVMEWNEMIQKPNLESAEMQMQVVDEKHVMRDGDVMIVEHRANK